MNTEMLLPVGTSMLTGWMPRLEANLKLPPDWGPSTNPAAKAPDTANWIPRLALALTQDGRTCAELDSVLFWLKKYPNANLTRITLVLSDTPPARWVAEVLGALLKRSIQHAAIDSKVVSRLSAERMREGLVELIRVSAGAIKDIHRRGSRAVINATPGFKAETSLLSLVGALLGAESVYLHEQMRDIIQIPNLALQWKLEPGQLAMLQSLGEAASRDEFRESGIVIDPELAPYVERVGTGQDEIWGLSPLGTLVTESVDKPADETLPPRTGEFEYTCPQRERAHAPSNVEATAREIANKFPFVKQVHYWRGFRKPMGFGLLIPHNDDYESGIVRVKLPATVKYGAMGLMLFTTATTEAQWRSARVILAATYGRVSLLDQLSDDEETSDAPSVPDGEFSAVVTEELFVRKLQRVQSANDSLASRVAELEQRSATATAEANLLKAKSATLGQQLYDCTQELTACQQTVARLEHEVRRLKLASQPADAGQGPTPTSN